jgi:hypothetical protein
MGFDERTQRFKQIRPGSSVVEHLLGKEEVGSSILLLGSTDTTNPDPRDIANRPNASELAAT